MKKNLKLGMLGLAAMPQQVQGISEMLLQPVRGTLLGLLTAGKQFLQVRLQCLQLQDV